MPLTRSGLLRLLAALGLLYVFLLSISMMGGAFRLFGARFAEHLIRNCSNPIVGLFIGILTTSLIQSSSTTTSLVVGFVGGGVLPLDFAIPIVMGANIGTTITNTLVSLGFVTRRADFQRAFSGAIVHDFFNLCTVALLFPLEIRFHLIRRLAESLTGMFNRAGGVTFSSPLKAVIAPVCTLLQRLLTEVLALPPGAAGVIMLILAIGFLMASLVLLVRNLRAVVLSKAESFVNRYLFRNDLMAFVLGIGLTVAVQSSSVTTSLVIPLVGAGIVTLYRCYPFTLGANIGTTCTALLASLATVHAGPHGSVGVTTAFAHLIFNVLGIAIFYPLRRIPIWMARRLARLAAESKRWAIAFIVLMFFGIPLLVVLLH
ncbi:MAG: Na/Pi symporter [Lentisphaerae bacterium]|nr:Na/Pi symporter [Lentisphaerota bacterium]